jgi:Uma2 family endonuclease
MTTATQPVSLPVGLDRSNTLAGLLDQLGGIPAERVLRYPAPGTATEADFLRANEERGILCELIDQTLVEKAMGSYESLLAGYLIRLLWNFITPRKLGIVLAPDGMFRLFEGNIRMPDVSFVPKDRFPNGLPNGPVWKLAPSLAVEVLSIGNTAAEIDRKRIELFANRVLILWVIDPVSRTAVVYEPDRSPVTKSQSENLEGGVAIPGFSLSLTELFGVMDL